MKSSCLDMRVFINLLNPVLWNFPRLKSNIHPPAWLSSQQYPHHTQPVCDIWEGGYHSIRTVWVLRPYLIRFSCHLFYCVQIPLAYQATVQWAVRKKTFPTKACPCFKPILLQVWGVLPQSLAPSFLSDHWLWEPELCSSLSSFKKHGGVG